ncbi:MAG TPA: hypothetical protein VGE22_11495, partial [Solimonas sp.]
MQNRKVGKRSAFPPYKSCHVDAPSTNKKPEPMNLELLAGLLYLANAFFFVGAAPVFSSDLPKFLGLLQARYPEMWERVGGRGGIFSREFRQSAGITWLLLEASYSKGRAAFDGELRDIGDRLRILLLVGGVLIFSLIPVAVLAARQR